MAILSNIREVYGRRGAETYFGERVTVVEHALQCAHFAQKAKASAALVVAALLHDIGHLVDNAPDELSDWHSDAHHEVSGARWLAAHFGPEVSEPVRLHVAAKRYLCATDAAYARVLSPASVKTLELQGGFMSQAECAAFESEAHYRDALKLRRWDDGAKVAGLATADFNSYGALIERLALAT